MKPDNRSSHDEQPATAADPVKTERPVPKRGAIPTPQKEIENATPYLPESDHTGDT